MTKQKKIAFTSVYVLLLLGMVFGSLKLLDWRIGRQYGQFIAPDQDLGLTIRTLDLYPYDGFHVQARTRHTGPMFWEYTSARFGAEAVTGDKGYFVDFPLDNPPAKLTNEFRVVLFGGSGAMGWGATTQDKMLYRVIERELQSARPDRKIRVVNMAMGSSTAYQNFISLNRYGHKLQPDLMLGYVGRNDYVVPVLHEGGTDWYCYSGDVQAFAVATRGYDCPPGLEWLQATMPNMMKKTAFGIGIKTAFGLDYYRAKSKAGYARATGIACKTPEEAMDKVAIPQLCLALKSIKRDFDGIPMMVAWQGISHELADKNRPGGPDFYDRMYDRVHADVNGTVNDRWSWVNIHRIGVANTPKNFPLPSIFATHLDDQTHAIVGRILAEAITQIIP